MTVRLCALERDELVFVHELLNNSRVVRYWFDEPYETLSELRDIYDRHVHDLRERRFIIDDRPCDTRDTGAGGPRRPVGIVELVHIDPIHRSTEFQIIVDPDQQGRGHATTAIMLALDYAFAVLNLHKTYLLVDVDNVHAIRLYEKAGFSTEGTLREEFFADGRYRDALRMSILQHEHLTNHPPR